MPFTLEKRRFLGDGRGFSSNSTESTQSKKPRNFSRLFCFLHHGGTKIFSSMSRHSLNSIKNFNGILQRE